MADSLRVVIGQVRVRPGQPAENTARLLRAIETARGAGAELVVFPEMAIPGYLLGDEWECDAFLRDCEACGEEVRRAAHDLTVVFGNVAMDRHRRNEDGRVRKYNALFVADHGRFVGPPHGPYPFVVKTLMPNYREFDDSRHFFDLRKLALEEGTRVDALTAPVVTRRARLGCALCEDAWSTDYGLAPLDLLARHPVDCFVNISASPFTVHKRRKRERLFSEAARRYGRPLLYVNKVGLQNNGKTVFTFDGGSCLYDGQGGCLPCAAPFEERDFVFDLPLREGAAFGEAPALRQDCVADLCRALRYGTRRFMELCGVERVVVGISGGIDSGVAAALYRSLLDPERLLLINMPSRFNSSTTRSLASGLARNLDARYAEVPIQQSVDLTVSQLHGCEMRRLGSDADCGALELTDFMRENVQARDRSSRVLAAAAAAFGGVFTCNANKSEVTVGYTTLYGDLGGYFANLGDLWKTEVYALARHLNDEIFGEQVIPAGALTLPPSAELGPQQNVELGRGDPLHYPYHDRLFASWIEHWNRATPEDVLCWYSEGTLAERIGYDGDPADLFAGPGAFIEDLERWWNRFQGLGLAKRIQAPPILAVKRRAFGFDYRESQMGARYTRAYAELKARLLGQQARTGGDAPPAPAPGNRNHS